MHRVPTLANPIPCNIPGARIQVNTGHIEWADIIFVMEQRQKRILKETFGEALGKKKVLCLNITNLKLRYMEPALIDELKAALRKYVKVPE